MNLPQVPNLPPDPTQAARALVEFLWRLTFQLTTIPVRVVGTATWDPPSVAAGAQTTTTVSVPGASVGDTVTVSFSADLQGMQLTGYVSATDTVTVVLRNGTGGSIDLGSGTLRADVWKR